MPPSAGRAFDWRELFRWDLAAGYIAMCLAVTSTAQALDGSDEGTTAVLGSTGWSAGITIALLLCAGMALFARASRNVDPSLVGFLVGWVTVSGLAAWHARWWIIWPAYLVVAMAATFLVASRSRPAHPSARADVEH